MSMEKPLGDTVKEVDTPFPKHETLTGRHVALLPMHRDHAEGLFQAIGGEQHASLYDYMGDGPFSDVETFRERTARYSESKDPQFYTIQLTQTGQLFGVISYLRVDPTNRSIEIGHLMFSPSLQRTTAATEAIYLLASKAFDIGYRRLEWKCNALNAASRRAALRFGYTYEGIFRQHTIIKGRNRDSAWFSILDGEWPNRKAALDQWMDPQNFDEDGKQSKDLTAIRKALVGDAAV